MKRVGCFVEGRKKLAHAHQKEIKKTYLLSRRGLLLDLAREGDVAVESKIEYANERRARFYFFQKKLSRSCRRRRRVRRSFAGAGDSRFHKRKKHSVSTLVSKKVAWQERDAVFHLRAMERHATKGAKGTRGRESRAKHTVFFFFQASRPSVERERERAATLFVSRLSTYAPDDAGRGRAHVADDLAGHHCNLEEEKGA